MFCTYLYTLLSFSDISSDENSCSSSEYETEEVEVEVEVEDCRFFCRTTVFLRGFFFEVEAKISSFESLFFLFLFPFVAYAFFLFSQF